ncbi:MAG: efflux RND transporter periplasmic adaptor subunit [Syntrophomonas sp.]
MAKKRVVLTLLLMILTLTAITLYYWYQNTHYVATEDARIDGDIVKVSPQVTGRIIELGVEEGQELQVNDMVGRQSDLTLTSGSNLDLTIIKAPISGTVLKKIAHVGEIGSPTSPVLYMTDLNSLFLSANIEEDVLVKIKPGQLVEYTLDTYPDVKYCGKVISIGDAANSVFSLIPQQNTGNSFVKITQRVPIKISIDDYHGRRLLPGMNARVKIHIK